MCSYAAALLSHAVDHRFISVLVLLTAFAELQTDMTEIAREISGNIGIPFMNYRDFCMKMLFPSTVAEEHPVIRGLEVSTLSRKLIFTFSLHVDDYMNICFSVLHPLEDQALHVQSCTWLSDVVLC